MTAVTEPLVAPGIDEPRLLPAAPGRPTRRSPRRASARPEAPRPRLLIGEVERAGLRGRGGAGFPTATKMEAVRANGARVVQGRTPIVVANGTEGEPLEREGQDAAGARPAPRARRHGRGFAGGRRRRSRRVRRAQRYPGAACAGAGDRRTSKPSPTASRYGSRPRRRATSSARRPRSSTGSTVARPNPLSRLPDRSSVVSTVDPRSSTTSRPSPTSRSSRASAHRGGGARDGRRSGHDAGNAERRHPSRRLRGSRSAHLCVACSARHVGAHDVIGVLVGGYFGTWLTPRQAAMVTLSADDLKAMGAGLGCGAVAALTSARARSPSSRG